MIHACNTNDNTASFHNYPVLIKGQIEDYNKIYKTGQLIYFDAVTRIVNNELFIIDSSGNFEVSFELLHPIIGSAIFDIEDNYYSEFYIEPNVTYNVTVTTDKLIFNGETGTFNSEISKFKDSLHVKLGTKIQEINLLHNKGLQIEEYLSVQKNIEEEKMKFLYEFDRRHSLTEKVFKVLENEIKFKTAHAWINYRYDYTTGRPVLRDSLPPDFYEKLYLEYPITNNENFQTRNCIDYISNITTILEIEKKNVDNKIEFFKASNSLSPKELEMLSKLYKGDSVVRNSTEYAKFNTPANWAHVRTLFYRYNISTLLNNVTQISESIGRDLVISQSISRNYFANNIMPTPSEWELIDSLISNTSILSYLHTFSNQKAPIEEINSVESETVKKTLEKVKEKYIDKYLGKVIYIDFYSTWCGPCRAEIPHAKALHHEFDDDEVIFLNLCAKSKEEDWKSMIKQKNIDGENYLLNDDEYNLLSKLYNVEAFPTYILIDKKGNVSNYEAPRPGSKKTIIDEINKLLE